MRPVRPVIALVTGSSGAQQLDELAPAIESLGDIVSCERVDLGVQTYRQTGVPLPAETLAVLRTAAAIVMASPPTAGASDTDIAPGVLEHGIVFALRKALGLTINLRTFQGVGALAGVDIAVVRENSEGAYLSPGDLVHPGSPGEAAVQAVLTTAAAVEPCVRFGFEQARRRGKELVVAHKVRVLVQSGGIWTRAAELASADYPEVRWRVESIDTCCGRIVADPTAYDVIVTENVFGDILADVASARAQAGEYAVSAEYAAGSGPSLFEPMHDTHSTAERHGQLGHLGLMAALGAAVSSLGFDERGAAIHAEVRARAEAAYGKQSTRVGSHS